MKSNLIKSAVAAALALAAGNAMAIELAGLTPTVMANLKTVYISGATATDNVFKGLATTDGVGLFQNGSGHVYQLSSSGSYAMIGLAAFSGNGINVGDPLAIVKETGGSANGIRYPATGETLPFIAVQDIDNHPQVVAPATGWTLSGKTYTFSGTLPASLTEAKAPYAGISDVEPARFTNIAGVTGSHVAALTSFPTVAVTFNPIVSVPLFRALQDAQGLVADGAPEDTTSLATVPSVSSSLVAAIFSGGITGATQVWVNGEQQLSAQLPAAASNTIYVCRRGNTSGTQLSSALHFLNFAVSSNGVLTNTFRTPSAGAPAPDVENGNVWDSAQFGNRTVFAGRGSGDVRACMDYHSAQNRYAIGVASTERKPNTTNERFRYVKIDGAAPTLRDVVAGNYPVFTQNTINTLTSAPTTTPEYSIVTTLRTVLGNKTVLAAVNGSWQNALTIGATGDGSADTGILDIPAPGNKPTRPVTGASVRANPVNGQLRQYRPTGGAYTGNRPYVDTP